MAFLSSLPADGPDSRISVLTAFALFITTTMSTSVFRSSGFIYIGIMQSMNLTRGEASWPLSILGATVNISSLLSGALCHIFSPRPILMIGTLLAVAGLLLSAATQNIFQLTMTMGVLYGIGEGCILTAANIFMTQHFVKYRSVAFGVVHGGCTMSSVVFPPLLLWLSSMMHFKWVIFTQGLILLAMFACSLVVREPKWIIDLKKESRAEKKEQKTSLKSFFVMMLAPGFIVLLISNITLQWCNDSFITTLVDFALDKGLTMTESVNLLPWFSSADIIGRIGLPILCDKHIFKRQTLMTLSFYLGGIFLATIPFTAGYLMMLLNILSLSLFLGCGNVLFPCMVGDYISLEYVPLAFGILGCSNGLFYFLKPMFFGYFRDEIKSYNGMFWACSVIMISTAILWTLIYLIAKFTDDEKDAPRVEMHKDLDACSAAASIAPASVSEAIRRASFLSSASNPTSVESVRNRTVNQQADAPEIYVIGERL